MLKRLFPVAVAVLFAASAYAQTPKPPKDDFEITDIPEEEAHPYFGLGGGANFYMLQPKFDDINAMTARLKIPALDGGMLLSGGAGFISAPFGKHLRIGGMGWGGLKSECADVIDTINGTPVSERRTAEFGVGAGGVTLDYVYPLGFTHNKVVIAGGVMLGLGSISLQLDQTTSDPRTFDNFFTGGASPNFTRQMHAAFFSYTPYLNVEYSILAFLMLRASVGYNGMSVGTWKVDRAIDISGVPAISGSGLAYGGGLFVGIFR